MKLKSNNFIMKEFIKGFIFLFQQDDYYTVITK